MAKVHSSEEILLKASTPPPEEQGARTLRTDRQQPDRRQTDIFAIANTRMSYSHIRLKICTLCGILSAISVLLTTENSVDLEIRVLGGSRSLKVTPVNSSCVLSYQSLIVTEAISCTVYEIQPSTGLPSLYFATTLAFNIPNGGVSLGGSRKILHGGQRMAGYTER